MNEIERVAHVLSSLDDITEDLQALFEDVTLRINARDRQARADGIAFLNAYQVKLDDFETASSALTELLQQLLPSTEIASTVAVQPQPDQSGPSYFARYSTIGLSDKFAKKHPAGFILKGTPHTHLFRWSHLYQALCRQLAEIYPEQFDTLPDAAELISTQGRHLFMRDVEGKKNFRAVGRGLYADTKLSANYIRDNIRKLLAYFGIDERVLTIYIQ